jgi:electron transfer flavoprotein beta subunit
MLIVVLVSQAPRPGTTPPFIVSSDGVCWDNVHQDLSTGDLHAVEAAVRLRATHGARVIAVTLGPAEAEMALRQALTQGADHAVHICDERLHGCDALATARVLAAAAAHLLPELVLCGLYSHTGSSGQVGAAMAEHLGWPFVGGVVEIELTDRDIIVDRLLEGGDRQRLRCRLPAVLGIAPQLAQPRYPPLHWRQRAVHAELRRWDLDDLGLSSTQVKSGATLVGLAQPRPRPKKIFAPDSHLPAAERMRLVMSGGLSQKHTAVSEAEPEAAARAIIEVLTRENFV